MSANIWVVVAIPVILSLAALFIRRIAIHRVVAVLLYIYLFVACAIAPGSIYRSVASQAQQSGEFSEKFILGATRLNDALLGIFSLALVLGLCMLLLIFFPAKPRAPVSDDA